MSSNVMQKWRPWDTASKVDWSLAVEREAVIRPLAQEGKLSGELVHEAMLRLNLGRSMLYKRFHCEVWGQGLVG